MKGIEWHLVHESVISQCHSRNVGLILGVKVVAFSEKIDVVHCDKALQKNLTKVNVPCKRFMNHPPIHTAFIYTFIFKKYFKYLKKQKHLFETIADMIDFL